MAGGTVTHPEGTRQTRVAVYARVSTLDQTTENQLLDLRRYAEDRGWKIAREYCDNGVSGAKDSRPELNRMMADARKRRSTWCWCGGLTASPAAAGI